MSDIIIHTLADLYVAMECQTRIGTDGSNWSRVLLRFLRAWGVDRPSWISLGDCYHVPT